MEYKINFILAENEKVYVKKEDERVEVIESFCHRNDYGEITRFMYDTCVAYVKEIDDLVLIDSNGEHWTPDMYEITENDIVFIHGWKMI